MSITPLAYLLARSSLLLSHADVRLYDMRAGKVRWQGDAGGPGVVSLQFDRKDIEMNKLVRGRGG